MKNLRPESGRGRKDPGPFANLDDSQLKKGKASKDFFEPEKLKTKTEKDYLMHLAANPVLMELEDADAGGVYDGYDAGGYGDDIMMMDANTNNDLMGVRVPSRI